MASVWEVASMSVNEISSVAIVVSRQSLALSEFFSVSSAGANPAYLVVNALDRNEYTIAANGSTGGFAGNGAVLALSGEGGDARGAGIVFTWQAATHQYVSSIYGSLTSLTYQASGNLYDVTNISVFTTSNLALAQQDATSGYALMQADAAGYVGSVTVATDPSLGGAPPPQATPDGVAAAAERFVGHAWNDEGCWVLASTIAAESGAGCRYKARQSGCPGGRTVNGSLPITALPVPRAAGRTRSVPATSFASVRRAAAATSPPACPVVVAPRCW
jgi:hypothetical protein